MPNATGTVAASLDTLTDTTSSPFEYSDGAFYNVQHSNGYLSANAGKDYQAEADGHRTIGLDLSKSNAIYGASSTVQPPACTIKMLIKY